MTTAGVCKVILLQQGHQPSGEYADAWVLLSVSRVETASSTGLVIRIQNQSHE